jgi:hypothetical protein
MGEKNFTTINPQFDKSVKIDFTGETVTSNAGVIMLAELDNKLGVIRNIAARLHDPRNPDFITHTMYGLLSQRLLCIAAGYEDGDDADDLREDPAIRHATGRKDDEAVLASQPSMSRLERHLLLCGDNLNVIKVSNLDTAIHYYKLKGVKHIWLDIDSYESPVHGAQEGAAYNGYYDSDCYHPLVLHDGFGFKLKVELRPGNDYTSTGAVPFLRPVLERLRAEGFHIHLTADSGYADPDIFNICAEFLVIYHIRLKSNTVLEKHVEHLLARPPGRPPNGPLVRYAGFYYGAGTWNCLRRVVAKVVHNPGELFAETYFIVTNSPAPNKEVFKRYGKRRGRAEQCNDEGKNMMFSTRLSCHEQAANDVRLQLYTLAYNLMILFRRLVLTGEEKKWTLATIRLRLMKIGARLTHKSRYSRYLFAAGPALRRLITNIFNRIARLPQPCG